MSAQGVDERAINFLILPDMFFRVLHPPSSSPPPSSVLVAFCCLLLFWVFRSHLCVLRLSVRAAVLPPERGRVMCTLTSRASRVALAF